MPASVESNNTQPLCVALNPPQAEVSDLGAT